MLRGLASGKLEAKSERATPLVESPPEDVQSRISSPMEICMNTSWQIHSDHLQIDNLLHCWVLLHCLLMLCSGHVR